MSCHDKSVVLIRARFSQKGPKRGQILKTFRLLQFYLINALKKLTVTGNIQGRNYVKLIKVYTFIGEKIFMSDIVRCLPWPSCSRLCRVGCRSCSCCRSARSRSETAPGSDRLPPLHQMAKKISFQNKHP